MNCVTAKSAVMIPMKGAMFRVYVTASRSRGRIGNTSPMLTASRPIVAKVTTRGLRIVKFPIPIRAKGPTGLIKMPIIPAPALRLRGWSAGAEPFCCHSCRRYRG